MYYKPIRDESKTYRDEETGYFITPQVPCPFGVRDLSKDECLIPAMVDKLIKNGTATVKAYTNKDKWYGITYREDKAEVQAAIKELCDQGLYDNM